MDALGRIINVLPSAGGLWVDLQNCSQVCFVGVNAAGETWTLQEAKTSAGGSAQNLATIDYWHVSATVGAAWSRKTQAAAATIVASSSEDVVVLEVNGQELSDGYRYVKLTATGAGVLTAIQTDLKVQRKPANLPALQ